jgi:hypothetical protein
MPDEPIVAPVVAPVVSGDPWYKGADAELTGHIQNKGWDKKPVAEVAMEATRSQREAEKLLGVPAERILRLPADQKNADEMKPVWQRLGAPADGKYDFTTVKKADGKPLDQPLVDALTAASAANSLTKDAALGVAQAVAKHLEGATATRTAEQTAALATEKAELDKNWGANKEANMFIVKNTAKNLGITPEAVAALEGVVGYKAVMDMMLNIGMKTGEAKFVTSQTPNAGGGVMTKEQAIVRKGELFKDEAWVSAYNKGDSAKNKEMLALNVIITGEAPSW